LRTALTVKVDFDLRYDVRWWFANDPGTCVLNAQARKLLRGYPFPLRPWIPHSPLAKFVRGERWQQVHIGPAVLKQRPRFYDFYEEYKKKVFDQQRISWWDDLRERIEEKLDRLALTARDRLARRFADYIAGYMLVCEGEQHMDRDQDLEGNQISTWRRGKRCFNDATKPVYIWRGGKWRVGKYKVRDVFGEWAPISAHPPHREHLKTTLTRLMVQRLRSKKISFADSALTIASVWKLIGETVLATAYGPGASIARAERRSRKRRAEPNKITALR
jgi:hypothetical protein